MKLSSLKITIAILILVFWTNTFTSSTRRVAAVNLPDVQTSAPAGWRKIDADGKFTFYLPPDMRDTGRSSLENFHREYTNGRMQVRFDYDPFQHLAYSNRATTFGSGFQEIELEVDGKKSFLFIHQGSDRKKRRTHNAELYVGDLPNSDVTMYMGVTSRSERDIETAKTIFRTIKFPS
jgi:hypothetical protein